MIGEECNDLISNDFSRIIEKHIENDNQEKNQIRNQNNQRSSWGSFTSYLNRN